MSLDDDREHGDKPTGQWSIGGGRPFPTALEDRELYHVFFDGPDDPLNPQNWPSTTK